MPNYIPTSTMDGKNNNVPAATEGRQPEKAVINGGAKIKEKSLLEKARDQFIYEDGKSILETFVLDIAVPALKNTIMSGATNALDMFLFGGNRQNNGGYYYGGNHYYGSNNYYPMNTRSNARQYYSNNYQNNTYQTQNPAKTSYGYDFTQVRYIDGEDPISHTFMTGRQRAGIVRDKMCEVLMQYPVVTVAQYLEFSGLVSDWTDNYYGWTTMDNVQIRSFGKECWLELPRPMNISDQ